MPYSASLALGLLRFKQLLWLHRLFCMAGVVPSECQQTPWRLRCPLVHLK